jgi:hypothetical protein
MDSISLPVVHPAFEKLKRSGSWLHVAAGLLILTHAISHFHRHESPTLYFWCQLIISLDIFILVGAGREILRQSPRVNLFFRVVEIVFFLGIGWMMLLEKNWMTACIHLFLCIAYVYLFYCERGFRSEELSIHPTGITIPGLPESRFLHWSHINDIKATYDSIHIITSEDQDLSFELRKNLDFAELGQINDFCIHYLGKASF